MQVSASVNKQESHVVAGKPCDAAVNFDRYRVCTVQSVVCFVALWCWGLQKLKTVKLIVMYSNLLCSQYLNVMDRLWMDGRTTYTMATTICKENMQLYTGWLLLVHSLLYCAFISLCLRRCRVVQDVWYCDTRDTCAVSRYFYWYDIPRCTMVYRDLGDTGIVTLVITISIEVSYNTST